MYLELYYCSRVLKTFETGFLSGKKDSMFKKNPRKFSKTLIISNFIQNVYQNLLLSNNSQSFQVLAFFGKIDRYLEKKSFWTFSKTLNFAFFFQMPLEIHYCSCDLKKSKRWIFWKKICIFFGKMFGNFQKR